MFNIGQKVVSLVNGTETNLKKNQIYTVTDVFFCKCGRQAINVDLMPSIVVLSTHARCSCGLLTPKPTRGLKYIRNDAFRLLDETFAEETIAMLQQWNESQPSELELSKIK